ncbi:MAG: glycosyltransferase family 4 protein [Anaerolineae bacterium]|nr:glycosyltransferase family 4 protein [Anaerolineae bacterium]
MAIPKTAILHYTAPPIVGGVEAVIQAHTQMFTQTNHRVTVIAGRGEPGALPPGVEFELMPEVDSQHPQVVQMSAALEQGRVPAAFAGFASQLAEMLVPILRQFDNVIVHNVFTKHFNLPLTAALHQLLTAGTLPHCIAWCHDFTWTSPNSLSKVHPGYPWDLLRTQHPAVTYVVVSQRRQQALAELFGCLPEQIQVVYNGIDPQQLLGLSNGGAALVKRLGLLDSDLVLLMPVRVTQAKNIEYAMQVVAALKSHGFQTRLVITGPPDPHDSESMAYFHSLQTLRKKLDVAEEVRFVFESGPNPEKPFFIDSLVVGDLFRVSDVMFMPSHREGFGMPVLEAGLAGVPVVCTNVPVAEEIGGGDVMVFEANQNPIDIAERILAWADESAMHRLRRRVRQNYTWLAIFERDIAPLLHPGGKPKC